MDDNLSKLTRPVTDIEMADLLACISAVEKECKWMSNTVRRMAFEIGQLRGIIANAHQPEVPKRNQEWYGDNTTGAVR
jgi:hypothetical protein